MTAVTCSKGIDCPRPANTASGRCNLHDAMEMTEEAKDLLGKALVRLVWHERRDRDVERPREPLAQTQTQATTCTRCGRKLRPLEAILATLEAAPSAALAAGQEQYPSNAYSFALGYLTDAVADAVRDLGCHAVASLQGVPR